MAAEINSRTHEQSFLSKDGKYISCDSFWCYNQYSAPPDMKIINFDFTNKKKLQLRFHNCFAALLWTNQRTNEPEHLRKFFSLLKWQTLLLLRTLLEAKKQDEQLLFKQSLRLRCVRANSSQRYFYTQTAFNLVLHAVEREKSDLFFVFGLFSYLSKNYTQTNAVFSSQKGAENAFAFGN